MSLNQKVFLINLDGSDARLAAAAKGLAEQGLEFERVPAFDGRGKSLGELPLYDEPAAIRYMGRPLLGSEVGCSLSHMKALRRFLETEATQALVLEDDCRFAPDLAPRLAEIGRWLEDRPVWHALHVSAHKLRLRTPLRNFGPYELGQAHQFPMLATGILWSRAGAEAMLREGGGKIDAAWDNFLRHWLTRSGKGLTLWPPLVSSSEVASDIDSAAVTRKTAPRNLLYGFRKQRRLWSDRFVAMKMRRRFKPEAFLGRGPAAAPEGAPEGA